MSRYNMYRQIAAMVEALPDKLAIETDGGERFTYRDIDRQSARYANAILSAGLRRGDRVAVQVEKTPQSLFLYLACLRAGLVYLPLNVAYQRGELDYFLRDGEPGLIVGRPQAEALLNELSMATVKAPVLTLDEVGGGSLAARAMAAVDTFDTVNAGADDLAVIIYTSGTTGRSKGAMLSHRNLAFNAAALVSEWAFSERDVLLHALPIFHVHGLFVANHCALTAGASLLWHRRFDPADVIPALARATVFMGVPTYYARLLGEEEFGRAHCAGVRLFVSGSAPLLAETHREFEARTGQRILERYGMSEAGMITSNPLNGERRAGTVGFPLHGVSMRIADDADVALASSQIGGVQIRGASVFRGYWRMPDKTREEFTADGWFRTGDVGVIDADGYLAIVGRAKDLIITGGYNVYPKEVELALDDLPGVAESAVVGVAHPDFGEAVAAVVVAKPGVQIDAAQLLAALKSRLANYKLPKRLLVVDALPRNAMGKVQKNLLRERFRDE